MAKINNGILGGFTGKVGTVVGYIRKGQPLIRSLPSKPAGDPSTKQLDARKRFAALRKIIPAFIPAMKIGFRAELDEKMVHCIAFSELWSAGVVGDVPECAIDYSKIIVSKGRRPELAMASISRNGDKVTAKWAPDGNIPPADGTDEVYLAIYSTKENFVRISAPVARSVGEITFDVPTDALHCYLFAAAAEEKETSTSQYFYVDQ
jgi:hypothetical protein